MDSAAFKKIIVPQYRQMYRISYAIVGKHEDAEDIVQEAILKMWDKRDLLDDVKNYAGYCSTMARYLSIDFVRREKISTDKFEQEVMLVTDDRNADFGIEQRELLQQITTIFVSLPKNLQRVMQLRVFSECSIEEIEKITGLTNGNIRTMLSRARKRMKELFEIQNR